MSGETVQIPKSELRHLISEVDLNKDSMIDYNEFLAMMKEGLKKHLEFTNIKLSDLLIFKP